MKNTQENNYQRSINILSGEAFIRLAHTLEKQNIKSISPEHLKVMGQMIIERMKEAQV